MVVSFRIEKKGKRYRPKPKLESTSESVVQDDEVDEERRQPPEIQPPPAPNNRSVDLTEDDGVDAESSDAEVPFIISFFPDGYFITTPSKSNVGQQNAVEADDLKVLRPYDIPSESLFTAIECGQLPVSFLNDIHRKYVNITVLCEVRDYRKKLSTAAYPSITKVSLKMSPDNVVKDIRLIADSSWEYGDILEAEARLLNALQPKLCLDPTPNLDRLCKEPTCIKLNLDIRGLSRKRSRQMSEGATAPESSNLREGDCSPKTGQPDIMNLDNQNVGESSTRPINHSPETSNLRAGDSRQVMCQSDYVNMANQNAGQSNMIAATPTNHASENSNSRAGDSRLITGRPDILNLANQNVGQSNMISPTRPIYHAPENSYTRAGESRSITGQPDFVNLANQDIGQSDMTATRPTNHAPENSNSRAGDSRSIPGQPGFGNLANQNVGQSNIIGTRPINHAPESSNLRAGDSRLISGQHDFVNVAIQNVGQRNMIATGPTNCVPEANLRSLTGQPGFVNLANQNIGQSNMIATRPTNCAPEGDSRSLTGQPDFVNLDNQNVGQSNMIVTRLANCAPEGDSTSLTGQPGFVNLANQNVGQSNMIATRPTNCAPEGDSRSLTGQPGFVNLANQNVGLSNMIATRPTNCAPEGDSRLLTAQPGFVNLANQNVGLSNMIATRPTNCAPEGDSRLLTAQPGFVNLANQNVGQSNMIATRPTNCAPEGDSRSLMGKHGFVNLANQNVGQSNMIATRPTNCALEGDSRLLTAQPGFVNLANQIVGQSNMIATRPTNCAPEGDSRSLTGQPGFVNLANQNVGQSNMIATRPINHAPENSNLRAGDSRTIRGQPGYVNLVSQNVGRPSNMIAAGPINLAPENSNLRAGDSRLMTDQPGFVNPANHNIGRQNNLITTRPIIHAPESLMSAPSTVIHESRYQNGVGKQPRHMQNHASQISCTSSGHDMMKPYMSDGVNLTMPSFQGKRGYQDDQMSCMVNLNTKRCRSNPDGNQSQQQSNRDGIQQLFDEFFNRDNGHHGSRYNVKQEPLATETLDRYELNRVHPRLPQQQLARSITPWNNINQNLEYNTKKEESFSGPVERRFAAAVGSSERGKSVVTSVAGIQSLTLRGKESMPPPQTGANWRSNSLPKTHGVGSSSSSSVGNVIGPFTDSSPIDGSTRNRFSTIGMLTARFKLNCRKNKIDDDYKPSMNFPTQQLKHALFDDDINNSHKDEKCIMPLSMSLVGGSINICKTRVLNFVQNERLHPTEDGFSLIPKLQTRLILSERASDGTVAMHLGELDDCDYLEEDHLLPTLANTHTADLLADQFCSLMFREGYQLEDDHVAPKPISTVESSVNSSCGGAFAIVDIQEGVALKKEAAKPFTNMPTHPQREGGLLAGVPVASSSRSQESEPQSSLFQQQQQSSLFQLQQQSSLFQQQQQSSIFQQQQQSSLFQQQQQEFLRSSAMISHTSNPMSMGQNISNMQQQQHRIASNRVSQLQQQSPMQRMEPGNVNNRRMMGSGRGRGRSPITGQNHQMSITQQGSPTRSARSLQALHSGPLTPIHAAFMATEPRMAHSTSGGLVVHSSNLGGNRQMHLGSGSSGVLMPGSGINRANHINPMPQRNVIAQPNLMLGMNQNQNQNRFVNQQLLGVEPSSHLQTANLPPEQGVSSPSPFDQRFAIGGNFPSNKPGEKRW